jgi:hypothetical protein
MKRQWDIEELIEHFTVVEEDEALHSGKPLAAIRADDLMARHQIS